MRRSTSSNCLGCKSALGRDDGKQKLQLKLQAFVISTYIFLNTGTNGVKERTARKDRALSETYTNTI